MYNKRVLMSIEYRAQFSNYSKVLKNAKAYGILPEHIQVSNRIDKKFRVYNTDEGHWVNFGALGYEDFTKHNDRIRQFNYLSRATKIKGAWKQKKYSPNNLAINILWR
jgi:hypothetical protein